jgi:hypothetical protein
VLRNYLVAMGKFRRYSASNLLLIVSQRPDATRVAGYHTWHKLRRQVTGGAEGIIVLAPRVQRACDTNACGAKISTGIVVGFRAAAVFDVAGTVGEPLPSLSRFEGNPEGHLERLKSLVSESGYSLEYSRCIHPAQGQCSSERIILLPDMTPAEEFRVLTHETAHALLHFSGRRADTTKCIRETEAEAVAFVVAEAVGLNTHTASCDYVKLLGGDEQTLARSLEHIQRTSAKILCRITPPQWTEWRASSH